MSRLTGSDALGLYEAYQAVYNPQELTEEQVWEEVEIWVNALIEEGYDLSDYTWEEMYESYLNEMGQRMTTGQATAPKSPSIVQSKPQVAGGGMGGRRGGGSSPGSVRPAVTASTKPTPQRRGLGNIPPAEGTGIGGPSDVARRYGRDTTSYQAGGGARSGQSVQATMQQGRTNLGRMDQGKPAPAGAKPTSGGSSVNPKSGLSAYSTNSSASASRPAASASRPAASRPAATSPAAPRPAATTPAKPSGTTPTAKPTPAPSSSPARPSLSSQADEIRKMRAGSLQRQGRTTNESYDYILSHLIYEGYANTVESAEAIILNMSEDWILSIIG
jgi:hypothetical protein